MRSLIVAIASALLLAVVVTEFIQRLWPSSYLALLITTAIALLINGIFNQRVAAKPAVANAGNRASQDNRGNKRGNNRDNSKDNAERDNARNSARKNERNKERNSERNSERGNAPRKKPSADAAAPAAASVPSGPREQGEVKWFNRSKGFGFIIRESGDEIFVHQRSIRGADDARSRPVLRDGEAVEFVVTEHDKGLQAEDVVATDRS